MKILLNDLYALITVNTIENNQQEFIMVSEKLKVNYYECLMLIKNCNHA